MSRLLDKAEEKLISEAIGKAEDRTSGEIRIHLETTCQGDPYERAVEVFYQLGMNETRDKNGVLIYLATDDHKLAIIGDEGINAAVPEGFWSETLELMRVHFAVGQFAEGLIGAVEQAGEKLRHYFPFQHDDKDELSNDISFGH